MFFNFINKKRKPKIIAYEEHKIDKNLIDKYALRIINRLSYFGYEAYIVGGAIRDLLCGRKPKDFDVVTNATPRQIKYVFNNSRIIGRRFKLVHIYFGSSIIETATFRKAENIAEDKKASKKEEIEENYSKSNSRTNADTIYGTIEEDFERRDFTLNSLYYDPANETIIDFVDGYEDIKKRVITPIQDASKSFKEDPVRMLRAVKYGALLDFTIKKPVFKKIKKHAYLLKNISSSRLYEEICKIFKSLKAKEIFIALEEAGLLEYFIPFLSEDLKGNEKEKIVKYMEKMDQLLRDDENINTNIYWAILLFCRMKNYKRAILTYRKQAEIIFACKENMSKMSIPINVIDYTSRVFVLLFKLEEENNPRTDKKRFLKNINIYETVKILEIVSDNLENIIFWKSMEIKKIIPESPPNIVQKDKKFHFYKRNSSKKPKKAITTKNFNQENM